MWAEEKKPTKEERKLNLMFEAACMLYGILYAFILFIATVVVMLATKEYLSEFAVACVACVAVITIWVPAELATIKGLEKIKND